MSKIIQIAAIHESHQNYQTLFALDQDGNIYERVYGEEVYSWKPIPTPDEEAERVSTTEMQ